MKKTIIVAICSLSLGAILAYVLFNKSIPKKEETNYKTGTAFQIGVYSDYNNALNIANKNNGIVIKDENIYRVYISLLTNEEAIAKITKYYDDLGLNYYPREVKVSTEFIHDISIYEDMINKSNNDTYNTINNNILNTYLNYL